MARAPHPAFSGWRICAAAVATQAVAIGFTLGSVGVFAAPLSEELGATATEFNAGVALFSLMMNFSMPFIGSQLSRGRIRGVMMAGACLLALSLAGMAQARSLWQLGLGFGVGSAIGMAMLGPMSSSTAMANWFERLRGRALGIANMGGPVGPILVVPAAAWAIGQIGWRGTLLVFAALTLVIGLPCVWFGILDKPGDVGQFPDGERPAERGAPSSLAAVAAGASGTEAPGAAPSLASAPSDSTGNAPAFEWGASTLVRSREFWFAALAVGPFSASGIVMVTNSIPFMMTDLGTSAEAAAFAMIPQSIGSVLGPAVFGSLADRIHPRILFVALIAMICASLIGLVLHPSYAVALGLFSVIGLVGGAMMPVYGALVARLFGTMAFGQVLGLGALVGLPAITLLPIAFGATFDATGNYSLGLLVVAGALAVAAVLFALLPSGEARRPA